MHIYIYIYIYMYRPREARRCPRRARCSRGASSSPSLFLASCASQANPHTLNASGAKHPNTQRRTSAQSI